MSMSVAVLVSLAAHPVSGRHVANPLDRTALDEALALPGAAVTALHVGTDPNHPALRAYLGTGLDRLEVVAVPAGTDILEPLIWRLRQIEASLVLAGFAAAFGSGSGLVPHMVAERLGLPLATGVRRVSAGARGVELDQALAYGKVRRLLCKGPAMATLHATAAPPRFAGYAGMRRGQIDIIEPPDETLAAEDVATLRPARRRPAPIDPVRGDTPVERLDRIQSSQTVGLSKLVKPSTPKEAARAILAELARHDVGPWAGRGER